MLNSKHPHTQKMLEALQRVCDQIKDKFEGELRISFSNRFKPTMVIHEIKVRRFLLILQKEQVSLLMGINPGFYADNGVIYCSVYDIRLLEAARREIQKLGDELNAPAVNVELST